MFFGIRPAYRVRGIDAVLFEETYQHALKKGYENFEASLLLEDNDLIIRVSAAFGGRHSKTWRIYEVPLQQPRAESAHETVTDDEEQPGV